MYKIIKNEVKSNIVNEFLLLHEIVIKYHRTHIIHALTTDASSHTNIQKIIKKEIIIIVLKMTGTNLRKNHMNIIKIVILNQLTAIRWVVQELLKLLFNSLGIFSLAQIKIHDRKIASSFG